jgi:hypothetical protein
MLDAFQVAVPQLHIDLTYLAKRIDDLLWHETTSSWGVPSLQHHCYSSFISYRDGKAPLRRIFVTGPGPAIEAWYCTLTMLGVL